MLGHGWAPKILKNCTFHGCNKLSVKWFGLNHSNRTFSLRLLQFGGQHHAAKGALTVDIRSVFFLKRTLDEERTRAFT